MSKHTFIYVITLTVSTVLAKRINVCMFYTVRVV